MNARFVTYLCHNEHRVHDLLALGERLEFPRVFVLVELGSIHDLVLLFRWDEVIDDEHSVAAITVINR